MRTRERIAIKRINALSNDVLTFDKFNDKEMLEKRERELIEAINDLLTFKFEEEE